MTHVSDALWSCWDQRTILRLERHVPSLKLTASPWKLLERHVPSLKLTASPWKLLIGRPKFKIPNGHRLVFYFRFCIGNIHVQNLQPSWLEVIPGADHVLFFSQASKNGLQILFGTCTEISAQLLQHGHKGGPSHIFRTLGRKLPDHANCCMICMERDQKRHKNLRYPFWWRVNVGPLTPVEGGEQSSHYGQEDDFFYTSPKRNKLQLAKFQTPASHTSSLSREGDNSIWFDFAPIFGSSWLFLFLEMLPRHPQATKTTSLEISIQRQSKVKAGSTVF